MNGLIEQNMGPGGPPAAEGPPEMGAQQPEAGMPELTPEDLTPEEAEAYERFMIAVRRAIYEQDYAQSVVDALKGEADVPKVLADMTYSLVSEMDARSKGMLSDELVAPVAFDTLGEIVEVAKAAGAEIAGRDVAAAAKAMMNRYFTESGASPEDLQALTGGIDEDALGAEIDKGGVGMEGVA